MHRFEQCLTQPGQRFACEIERLCFCNGFRDSRDGRAITEEAIANPDSPIPGRAEIGRKTQPLDIVPTQKRQSDFQ